MSNQDDGVIGVFFLKGFNLLVWRFTIFQKNEPTVMTSWYLAQVHFNKVP